MVNDTREDQKLVLLTTPERILVEKVFLKFVRWGEVMTYGPQRFTVNLLFLGDGSFNDVETGLAIRL